MHVHLVGVSGTGMGALAMLLRQEGHRVSGSDASFDPPIGPRLAEAGIECWRGFDPGHLEPRPDLVVVGNAIRRENPEAQAAEALSLPRTSMSAALRRYFLEGRKPLVVAGTHGKTTTSAMAAHLLSSAELEPGWFIGGLPKNLPSGAAVGSRKRRLATTASSSPVGKTPFVVEGDEYDAVYWHKQPKFMDYVGASDEDVVIVTSVEHDHIDIYPDDASYQAAFGALAEAVPQGGLIVCDASHALAVSLVRSRSRARVVYYALEGDATGDVTPTWMGAPVAMDGALQPFDLYGAGTYAGRCTMPVPGAHNVRNALACMAACTEGFGVSMAVAKSALATFEGVRRRQDLLGTPGGVFVYDDFAHHPTAVDETLKALRAKHTKGALITVFEPRSATACRSIHQNAYVGAFARADRVLFAPLGRANVPESERLDLVRLAHDIGERAEAVPDLDSIVAILAKEARPGDVVALLSNGSFGGIHARVLEALGRFHRESAP
jgi:UDP-N-acetylmuramate: L-alanyl-gamma-D-glutamyl-meso-diaminopimelate ligase